ncbi:MAG TPA: polysaccharide biosynthesis/export family protein [Polyangia bacterium]|nr:polysaccharide biosynthesis/export family protein [Polyangia bacterium]
MTSKRVPLSLSLAALVLAAACANLGEYVWVADYRDPRPPASNNTYVLGTGDVVSVRVFGQEAMSAHGKIRTDGKLSLPFLNDVQAEGYTPAVLAEQLEARLKDYVNKPVVTVSVEEQRSLAIPVVGDVGHQGTITLPPDAGVLTALAAAGGLLDIAHRDRIFVIRNESKPVRIRFSWKELQHAEGAAGSFRLRQGDQIVVE